MGQSVIGVGRVLMVVNRRVALSSVMVAYMVEGSGKLNAWVTLEDEIVEYGAVEHRMCGSDTLWVF